MSVKEKETKLIAKLILERLNNIDKWGGAHSELKRVIKSLPSHIRENVRGKKQINKAVKLLSNLNFLLIKPSTGELHVSLNPAAKKQIYEFIEKNEKKKFLILRMRLRKL